MGMYAWVHTLSSSHIYDLFFKPKERQQLTQPFHACKFTTKTTLF